jgi:hypothetical protein
MSMSMRDKIKQFLEIIQFYDLAKDAINSLLAADNVDVDYDSIFSTTDVEERIINLYEDMFSESELDAILYFFNAPVGKKMIKINNDLSESVNKVFSQWVRESYTRYLEERM